MKKIILILIAVFCVRVATAAPVLDVLTDADVDIYQQIFALQGKEKIDAAKKLESKLTNKLLMNEVLYQRFFSKTYKTKGAEVSSWMNKYYDMPGAERVEKLSKIKKVKVRKPVVYSSLTAKSNGETAQSETWTTKTYSKSVENKIANFKRAIRSGSTKRARNILEDKKFKKALSAIDYGRLAGRLSYIYYTNGELELAKKWGFVAADADSEYGLWTMGLLYYKEAKYKESEKYFSKILELSQINDARKGEAAFWAGRAADANDDMDAAKKYWEIGAARPMSFYGALSATMLGRTPEYEFFEQDCSDEDIDALRELKLGKIALALIQVNQKARAEQYLKSMITTRATDKTLHAINSVATAYDLPRIAIQISGVVRDRGILEIDDDIIYSAQYPLPDWEPMGGWSIDRALLFAITKQESGFRTTAKSGVGANGVMQLMPGTAKLVAHKNKVKWSDMDMSKPEHNMFLGQQYIVDLLQQPVIDNSIIKMLAAYNAGIGNVAKFEKTFSTYDPLLYIESFPAYETRGYIKRVLSNLWLYRARLNQPLTSMQELANGQWPLYTNEDEYVQQQIENRMSI
ncbi:MAG: lytic transglycosylase domain-containing protein [Alphaproteobacteria bacterium]|nr:lytic transglycosylase domain-containing protein [Alphaproteobacteria bacterium]